MKNKSVISIAILVLIILGISGCIDNNQNATNTSYQTSNQNTGTNNTQNSTSVAISPAEAKKNAEKYIEEPGATAGTPMLINTDGKSTYVVPVILNGNQVGEILIDAQTGENMGGAGGVSNSV